MRSGNPALKDSTFLDLGTGSVVSGAQDAMSLNGTVNKTAFLLVLTLAGALSVPMLLNNGQPFPGREMLVFLATGTILFTLVLGSIALPLILRGQDAKKAGRIKVDDAQSKSDAMQKRCAGRQDGCHGEAVCQRRLVYRQHGCRGADHGAVLDDGVSSAVRCR